METFNIGIIKALADITRLKIIKSLQDGAKTAGQIEGLIGKTQSSTSQQLKKLLDAKILVFKQDGTKKRFRVKDPQIFDLLHSIQSYLSLVSMQSSEIIAETEKILIMGLNNSGKTSILLNMAGKNLLSYTSPVPTARRKHITEILKTEIPDDEDLEEIPEDDIKNIYWEAGGQEVYRNEYLEKPEKYIVGFERIIFVVDIQDKSRYEEALAYLSKVLEKLSKRNIPCKIDIYLHKYDPGIEKSDIYSEEDINRNLTYKIRPIVPPQFKLRIYKTSLFTVFRRSLVD
jgi:DNA-binding transcriptional ArsR family regulator